MVVLVVLVSAGDPNGERALGALRSGSESLKRTRNQLLHGRSPDGEATARQVVRTRGAAPAGKPIQQEIVVEKLIG